MYRRVLCAPVVLGCALLGACSDGASRASGSDAEEIGAPVADSSDELDPCALLSATDIERITDTVLPAGETPTEHDGDGWATCNWEDPEVGAAIQVQVHLGDGRADFERRRHELGSGSVGPTRDVDLAGADAAYDNADQGVVGALVGEHFVQLAIIGGSFDDQHHLALAEAAIQELDR